MATVPQRWQTSPTLDAISRVLDPPWRRARSAERRAWAWAALAVTLSCYLLAFLSLHDPVWIAAMSALPVVVAGWGFGMSGGAMVALLTIPLQAALSASGVVFEDRDGELTVALGLAGAIAVGLCVGAARDLRERLRARVSPQT